LNQNRRNLIIRGTRTVAFSVSVFIAAAGLASASGASAREARSGPVAELASQLLPIRGGSDAAIDTARQVDLTISGTERVLVRVYVSGSAEAAAETLRNAGMFVKATAEVPVPVVEGWIKATDLTTVAALGVSKAITPIVGGGSDAGLATSEGVVAHRIPQALSSGASAGVGVDVGVISDSIGRIGGGVAASQASGDLPPAVTILKEDFTSGTVDEGRAMAEIIFDGAPGIDSILFASGTAAGPADKADSIDQLVANGAEVIADDIFWLEEPFFQDGVIAQAADRARAAGVTYIASAGNRGRQSWEGTYSGLTGQGSHDFVPGAGVDTVQTLTTIADGGSIQLTFQWDEPWGQVANDMDIELVRPDGNPLPCFVEGQNPGGGGDDNPGVTGVPLEIVTWANDCGAGNVEVALKINRFSGTLDPFMKYIARGSFSSFNPEYATNSNTINPDAASAEGALTVAAVDALDPFTTPRPYSSRGPVSKLFSDLGQRLPSPEVRQKPELAAADGVTTTVPGFETFFGSSAAVPSAASIAAILRSSNPTVSAAEIERVMTDPANAIDCRESALIPDPDCGAGFLLADTAYSSLDKTVYKARIGKVTVTGPARVKKGRRTAYRVRITNSGNARATGVRLVVSGRGIRFNVSAGTINAGATRTVNLRLRPSRTGRVKATFKVTSSNAGSRTARKTITVRK
jgi:hypothetical protein